MCILFGYCRNTKQHFYFHIVDDMRIGSCEKNNVYTE